MDTLRRLGDDLAVEELIEFGVTEKQNPKVENIDCNESCNCWYLMNPIAIENMEHVNPYTILGRKLCHFLYLWFIFLCTFFFLWICNL